MSQWPFVIAAYGLVSLATIGLIAWAYWSMRKAEADAEAVKRRQ
jgi:cbb3-type cytochrome oxidase subunit 3